MPSQLTCITEKINKSGLPGWPRRQFRLTSPSQQKPFTPQRVRQSLPPIFVLIGTPARPPQMRGKSPGWPKGKPRTPKERPKVVKKGATEAQTA
ncbi:MAG: hypothetical protein ACK8QZ_00335 [Anaerolineales bacterium]